MKAELLAAIDTLRTQGGIAKADANDLKRLIKNAKPVGYVIEDSLRELKAGVRSISLVYAKPEAPAVVPLYD